jgi:hypothetical protein
MYRWYRKRGFPSSSSFPPRGLNPEAGGRNVLSRHPPLPATGSALSSLALWGVPMGIQVCERASLSLSLLNPVHPLPCSLLPCSLRMAAAASNPTHDRNCQPQTTPLSNPSSRRRRLFASHSLGSLAFSWPLPPPSPPESSCAPGADAVTGRGERNNHETPQKRQSARVLRSIASAFSQSDT